MAGIEQKYFYEDEVWRMRKGHLKLGMIVETSEYSSDDDSSDDEDEQIKPGHVRVAWYPLGEEEVLPEKKLSLVDRSLMPGDVVRRTGDEKNIQRGFCRKVKMFSSLEIVGTNQVIYGVPTEELVPLDKYRQDILICKDGWVGIVRDVKSNITLRFPDLSKVSVEDSVASDLEDVFTRKDHDTQFRRYDFYPGQILFGPVSVVEEGNWHECSQELKSTRINKPMKAYKMSVDKIDVRQVSVNWLCRANFGSVKPQESDKQPSRHLVDTDISRVRMLNVYEPITVQMGDRNYYRIKESDALITKSEWKKIQMDQLSKRKGPAIGRLKSQTSKSDTSKSGSEANLSADDPSKSKHGQPESKSGQLETKSEQPELKSGQAVAKRPDVPEDNSDEYEDCDEDKDTESNCSDKADSSGDAPGNRKSRRKGQQLALSTKGFKKKKLRMSRSQKESSPVLLVAQVGMRVVTETLCTKSEVEVVWQDGSVESNVASLDLYPIQHLDDHEFFPGDFVIESKEEFHPHNYGVIQSVDYVERCCKVKWYRTYTEGSRPEPVFVHISECSVYDLKEHPDFKFKPGAIVIRVAEGTGEKCGLGAGQVLDINTDGQVQVWWADEESSGTTGLCYPQDIYKVGEYDSDDGELWADDYDEEFDEEANDSDDSWSTEIEYEVQGDDDILKEDDSTKEHSEDSIRQQILLGFDKVREELLQQRCTGSQSCCVKNLLAMYQQMSKLDSLMATNFFDESNFDGLIDELKEDEKISSVERAVQNHVTRLFSHSGGSTSSSPTSKTGPKESLSSPVHSTPDKDSGTESFIESPKDAKDASSSNSFSDKTTTSGKEEDKKPCKSSLELNLSSTKESSQVPDSSYCSALCEKLRKMLKGQLYLAHEVARQKYGDQTLQDFTKIFEMCENVLDNVDSELELLNFIPCDTPVLESKSILSPTDSEAPGGATSVVPLTPGSFQTVESVPETHKFKLTIFQPRKMKAFVRSIKKEIELLRSSLPSGITMKGFDDRMDLFSAMIEGPKNTPYEDGLFFFDFQLGPDYPSVPPTCNYISYCSDKLNPNLYEDGKVCVSLLGTWNGKGTETWTPDSNLLQLLVSIQGLILVREPYYNEAGYEKQRGTLEAAENSRNYNEMAVLKLVQSMTRLVKNPPSLFAEEIRVYCDAHAPRMIDRLEKWIGVSLDQGSNLATDPKFQSPDFPLLPASKGFCLSLQKAIASYKEVLGIK